MWIRTLKFQISPKCNEETIIGDMKDRSLYKNAETVRNWINNVRFYF